MIHKTEFRSENEVIKFGKVAPNVRTPLHVIKSKELDGRC